MKYVLKATITFALVSYVVSRSITCPPTNLCYAIDESGSVSPKHFEIERNFLIKLSSEIVNAAPGSSFATVEFNSKARIIQPRTDRLDVIIDALQSHQQRNGHKSFGAGLRQCQLALQGTMIPGTIVLLTNGENKRKPDRFFIASSLKKTGVGIITIGIGKRLNKYNLRKIASSPIHFIQIPSISSLMGSLYTAVQAVCEVSMSNSLMGPSAEISSTLKNRLMNPIAVSGIATPTSAPTQGRKESETEPNSALLPIGTPTAIGPIQPSKCAVLDCARRGPNLECFVNSGSLLMDEKVCTIVKDRPQFRGVRRLRERCRTWSKHCQPEKLKTACGYDKLCPFAIACLQRLEFCKERKYRTICGQQGLPEKNIHCYPGQDWSVCPVIIGAHPSFTRVEQVALHVDSNMSVIDDFASYQFCFFSTHVILGCVQHKCDEGICSCHDR